MPSSTASPVRRYFDGFMPSPIPAGAPVDRGFPPLRNTKMFLLSTALEAASA